MKRKVSEAAIQDALAHGIPHAVRHHGASYKDIYNALERRRLTAPRHKTEPDARLAEACMHATPGVEWTQEMIAEAMGVTPQYVGQVEGRAIESLRRALRNTLSEADLEAICSIVEPRRVAFGKRACPPQNPRRKLP